MTAEKYTGILCPICNSEKTVYLNGDEAITCLYCSVIRTKFHYDPTIYGDSYAENYLKYADTDVNVPLNLCRLGIAAQFMPTLNSRLLDVGCCVGEFLRHVEMYYPNCYGFEPNLIAAKIANTRISSAVETNLESYNGTTKKFDVITMFDVIEHIECPKDFLKYLKNFLTPKGVFVITSPNSVSSFVHNDITKWKHYKSREHLFVHSIKSLWLLFEELDMRPLHTGYEESRIRPGNMNNDIFTLVVGR